MATKYTSSLPQRCNLCNAIVNASFLTRHRNERCFARPKPGQRLAPGTCPHCLQTLSVTKMETHLLHECPRLTIPCPFCTYRFSDILKHLWKKHRDKRDSEHFKRLKNPPDPYQTVFVETRAPRYSELAPDIPDRRESCPVCHAHMVENKLKKHVAIHCKVKCPCCKGKFKNDRFQTHLINNCLPKLAGPSNSVPCIFCSKRGPVHFMSQHLSENHLTLQCPVCSNSMSVNRVLEHLRNCSTKNSPASHMETPLLPGVFQKFRELGENDEVYSGSDLSLSSDDSSDEEPISYRPRKHNRSDRSSKSKRLNSPFIDLTDPSYILLPASPGKKGKKGTRSGATEDNPVPSVSWNCKISCPICNTDCPLRMVGRHIIETHISHCCPMCNESIGHSSFRVHLEKCLGGNGAKGEKGRSHFPCPYCSKSKPSVKQMATHISRIHRELDCPFCQESYAARSYTKHVNNCARMSVMSAQLFQENPSLDPDPRLLQFGSSEELTDSDTESDGYESLPRNEAHGVEKGLFEGEAVISCIFCHFQCIEIPLGDHIAECAKLPPGMQLVSIPNLMGLRIN